MESNQSLVAPQQQAIAPQTETPTPRPKETAQAQKTKHKTLSQAELADRLCVNSSTIGRNRDKGNIHLQEWSKSKDEEGLAWQYSSKHSVYYAAIK